MGIRDFIMLILGYGCVPLALYDACYELLARGPGVEPETV